MASVKVTDEIAGIWHTDEEALWELAKVNTPRLFPIWKEPLESVVAGYWGEDGPVSDNLPLWLLSNGEGHFGAAAICYDGILDEMLEEAGCSLIVLPSSVHEVLVLKDDGSVEHEDLIRLVRVVNCTTVAPEDFLSDNIYLYQKGGWADRCLVAKG